MSFTSNAGTLRIIEQTATAAGAAWPDALADALADADAVRHAAPTAPDPTEAAQAAYAALAAGNDPADDPDVRRALARHQLAVLVPRGALEGIASRARLEALTDHADQLYTALAEAVAEADAAIQDARDQLGDLDLFDQQQAANVTRPQQAAAWAAARDATTRVANAITCWDQLARLTGGPNVGNNYRPLQVADLTADQLDAVHRAAPQATVDHRDVIRAGHPLDLATPAVYQQRIEQVLEQRDAQQHRDAQAWRDQHSLAGRVVST